MSTTPAVSEPSGSPAELRSTPVDGVNVLGALSPSRASDFMTCPLLYRFRTIDRLPEEPSADALRGTLVHKVLEDLFDLPAPTRTPEQARDLLVPTWDALLEADPSLAELFTDEGPEVAEWLGSCRAVLDRYFTLEDPRRLEPAERELYVEALLDSKLLLRGFVDRLDVAADGAVRVVDYKGLALDTPLPTPGGWTTMANVQVGDELLARDGRPTSVTAKSSVHHRPCYRVRFDDGSAIVCDNVHQWTVVSSRRRQETRHTLDTDSLADLHCRLLHDGLPRSLWVEAAAPLQLPPAPGLPLDPWLLGAWLGAGHPPGRLVVGRQDAADMRILVKQHSPGDVGERAEQSDFTDLSAELMQAGVRDRRHIPLAYLRAAEDQRIDVLRGLMDSHGLWHATRRRARFTTTSDRLAGDVVHLLHTLGICPTRSPGKRSDASEEGLTSHVIEFNPLGFNPFSLPRKAIACDVAGSRLRAEPARRRVIVAVEPVDSVPTQCIAVDSEDALYLCGETFVPTHNTGRSPGEMYEAKALFQMKFYALVIWRTRGVVPAMLQLVYLGNGEMLRYVPDETDLLATERKVQAIWQAIARAQEAGHWRPSRSRLCDWCSFQALCPEFGGTPPPLPQRVGDPGELTGEDVD